MIKDEATVDSTPSNFRKNVALLRWAGQYKDYNMYITCTFYQNLHFLRFFYLGVL